MGRTLQGVPPLPLWMTPHRADGVRDTASTRAGGWRGVSTRRPWRVCWRLGAGVMGLTSCGVGRPGVSCRGAGVLACFALGAGVRVAYPAIG